MSWCHLCSNSFGKREEGTWTQPSGSRRWIWVEDWFGIQQNSSLVFCVVPLLSSIQMAQAWPGPGPSPARGQILVIWGPRNPEIQSQKKIQNENSQIQIRSAQNVGKVWISRKTSSWLYLGPSQAMFYMDRKKSQSVQNLPMFLGGPMGPIYPVWGPRQNIG